MVDKCFHILHYLFKLTMLSDPVFYDLVRLVWYGELVRFGLLELKITFLMMYLLLNAIFIFALECDGRCAKALVHKVVSTGFDYNVGI